MNPRFPEERGGPRRGPSSLSVGVSFRHVCRETSGRGRYPPTLRVTTTLLCPPPAFTYSWVGGIGSGRSPSGPKVMVSK